MDYNLDMLSLCLLTSTLDRCSLGIMKTSSTSSAFFFGRPTPVGMGYHMNVFFCHLMILISSRTAG